MKENKNVIKIAGDKSRVYCQEDYAQSMYDAMYGNVIIPKDMNNGDLYRVTDFRIMKNGEVEAICDNMGSLFFTISKEKKYFELIGITEDSFERWVLAGDHRQYLIDRKIFILVDNAKTLKGSMYSAHLTTIVTEFKEQIANPTAAYNAKVLSKNQGGFLVEVQGIKAFLPGSLAAANKITDFESFIGKNVTVMIEDFLQTSGIFVVSYKKYLTNILPSKLAALERNQKLIGTITGTSKFGIFVEFEEIFTGLLHAAEMDPTTTDSFNERGFEIGDEMEVWLKDIRDNKLILTQIDPSIRQNEMETLRESVEGVMKEATIVSIKPHGALMEIEKGVIGLLPIKEMKKTGKRLIVGEKLEIFIKKVDSSTGKIYLTLTEEVAAN
jgi:ribosomal protein S1